MKAKKKRCLLSIIDNSFFFVFISVISFRIKRLRSSQRSAMSLSPNWERNKAGFTQICKSCTWWHLYNQSHLNFFLIFCSHNPSLFSIETFWADYFLAHNMEVFMKHKVATRFIFIEVKDFILLIFWHGIYIALVWLFFFFFKCFVL